MNPDCLISFQEAIAAEQPIQFEYTSRPDEGPMLRTFSPWELSEDESTVIGWDHDREGVRRFFVTKSAELRPYTHDTYVQPAT